MGDRNDHDDLLARWLTNELTPEEQASLNEKELQDLRVVAEDITHWSLPPIKEELDLYATDQPSEKKKKHVFLNRWVSIAASLLLLVGVYFGREAILNQPKSYLTDTQESINILLPDQSQVILDKSSSLTFIERSFEEDRKLDLEGQAYFEVASGKGFTVNTAIGSIRVLGTKFNVKSIGDLLEVSCYEGSVAVNHGKQTTTLNLGEKIQLEGAKNSGILKIEEEMPVWTQGFLDYDNVALVQVCEDLSRYYDPKIALPTRYHQLKYTGRLPLEDFEAALSRLFLPMEINYRVSPDGQISFE